MENKTKKTNEDYTAMIIDRLRDCINKDIDDKTFCMAQRGIHDVITMIRRDERDCAKRMVNNG